MKVLKMTANIGAPLRVTIGDRSCSVDSASLPPSLKGCNEGLLLLLKNEETPLKLHSSRVKRIDEMTQKIALAEEEAPLRNLYCLVLTALNVTLVALIALKAVTLMAPPIVALYALGSFIAYGAMVKINLDSYNHEMDHYGLNIRRKFDLASTFLGPVLPLLEMRIPKQLNDERDRELSLFDQEFNDNIAFFQKHKVEQIKASAEGELKFYEEERVFWEKILKKFGKESEEASPHTAGRWVLNRFDQLKVQYFKKPAAEQAEMASLQLQLANERVTYLNALPNLSSVVSSKAKFGEYHDASTLGSLQDAFIEATAEAEEEIAFWDGLPARLKEVMKQFYTSQMSHAECAKAYKASLDHKTALKNLVRDIDAVAHYYSTFPVA